MKIFKLKTVALLLVTISTLYSCQDILENEPESFVDADSFYKDQGELDIALAGVYDGLQLTYSNANFIFGEFRSDSFSPFSSTTNTTRTSFHNSTMDVNEASLRWTNFYRAIDRANRVIIAAESLPGITPNTLGEAYAVRSKLYFDLIRIWKDVPLLLEPIKLAAEAYKPVTSSDVIMNTVVIPDMLRAESLISETPSSFRFSKGSVYAHQAEVYMWLKTNENTIKAEDVLQKIIDLKTYSLVTTPLDWQNLFYNQPRTISSPNALGKIQTGSELMFSIRFEDTDNTVSGVWSSYITGSTSSVISSLVESKWIERFPIDQVGWETKYPNTPPPLSRVVVDPVLGSTTEPIYGDFRQFVSRERGDLLVGMGPNTIGDTRFMKWTPDRNNLQPNLDRTDVVMYRYADMLLLLAEAKIKLGKPSEAIALINEVRTARKLPAVLLDEFGDTENDQIDYLLDERQFELLGEGKRWWDLIRNDKALEYINPILNSRNVNLLTPERLFFPIYQVHIIEALGNYKQNLGWGS